MKLTDHDILELNELCNAVVDETVTDDQRAALTHWLTNFEEARQFYVRVTGMSASLFCYAGEMQTGEPAVAGKITRRWKWMFSFIALAACVAMVVHFGWMHRDAPIVPTKAVASTGESPVNDNEYVAYLSAAKDCQWASKALSVLPGGRLRKGQQLQLAAGFAEITFDSGAQVLLQGPASLDINSAWSAVLNHGALKASLPPEAMGFRISNPTVDVVDLGTEFTMFADSAGSAAEVFVLKGEVEAAPRSTPDQQPIVLRERESRRFASTGMSAVDNSEQKFQNLTRPLILDRYLSPIGYARWSFDESEGEFFRAYTSGVSPDAWDAKVQNLSDAARASLHAKGKWRGALRFDGNLYAKAAFPGMSENSPRTIAFWAKVPKDANLTSAYAMVAWAAKNSKQFGSHPFHIGWNRNANEGLVGVLRTDYGRGYAIGTTPLRDGRWHHVAVVFIPREDSERPVEVKQYVDGRLEGEGRYSPPGSDIFMSTENTAASNSGTIWLGCRLGIKGVRNDRFYGEMDELLIADRALEPHEIVRLFSSNRLDDQTGE